MDTAVPITFGAVSAHSLDVRTATATAVEFPSNLKLPSHEHERATVAVVLRGGFTEVSRGEERECTSGTVLVEPAGAMHANRFGRQRTSVVTLSLCAMGEGSPLAELAVDLHVLRDPFVASSGHMMECEIQRPDEISPLAV
jgi:mannose-6-phosphate isomerase-like protein (cupin superfamily)